LVSACYGKSFVMLRSQLKSGRNFESRPRFFLSQVFCSSIRIIEKFNSV
jgi:hypothetical protein